MEAIERDALARLGLPDPYGIGFRPSTMRPDLA